ncbi:MAG: antitoxin MazE family protein [Pseudorhodoplanes sp.]
MSASRSRTVKSPLTSREKVAAHRARMRALGLRPVTIWVPDTRAAKFSAEAARQSKVIAMSREERDEMHFIESISWWTPGAKR